MNYQRARMAVYDLLKDHATSKLSRVITLVLVASIIASIIGVMLASIPEVREQYLQVFWTIDLVIMAIFMVEYLARLWTCVEDPRYRQPILGRLRYVVTPMALIDLVAILPTLLTGLGIDLRSIRIARLLRLARAMKFVRYVHAVEIIGTVIRRKRHQLATSFLFVFFMLIIISTLMYEVENAVQPEVFTSIPHTMWWAVATLTTVGYGDIYPITALGKILAALSAVTGIGLVAIPTGILASGFSEIAALEDSGTGSVCPHCGKPL